MQHGFKAVLDENPGLAAYTRLDDAARFELERVVARFDREGDGRLSGSERRDLAHLLQLFRKPDSGTLAELNKVLDYLDFNANHTLDADETRVALEVLHALAGAEPGSNDRHLSHAELHLARCVLGALDKNGSGRLDRDERRHLRDGLTRPGQFLRELGAHNAAVGDALKETHFK